MISESIRDKNCDADINTQRVMSKMKITIIYTLLGGIKRISHNMPKKRGGRISTFLCMFIFFQLNLSLQ